MIELGCRVECGNVRPPKSNCLCEYIIKGLVFWKIGNFEFKQYKSERHKHRTSQRLVLSVTLSTKENTTGENDVIGSSSRYNPPNRWDLRT